MEAIKKVLCASNFPPILNTNLYEHFSKFKLLMNKVTIYSSFLIGPKKCGFHYWGLIVGKWRKSIILKWFTSLLAIGCWLMDHVIYLSWERNNDNYFHSKQQPRTILSGNRCHFVNLLSFTSRYFCFFR